MFGNNYFWGREGGGVLLNSEKVIIAKRRYHELHENLVRPSSSLWRRANAQNVCFRNSLVFDSDTNCFFFPFSFFFLSFFDCLSRHFFTYFFFSIIDLQVPEISSEKLNDPAFLRSNRGLFLHLENTQAVRTTYTERDAEEDGANYTVKDARPTPNEDTRNFEKTTGVAKSNEDSQTSKASYTDGELSDGEEVTRVNCKQFRNRTSVSTAGFC